MTVGEITAVIIAVSGVMGLILSHKLGIIGQKNDAKQQAAATKLQERIAAFDELESLNDRLNAEIGRLRDLVNEAEARGDVRLAAQGRRCRDRIEELTTAVSTLQSVVLSEVARASASDIARRADEHLSTDHPEGDQR